MRRLPDAELDVMDVLWSATGPLTTRAVVESVPADRGWKIQTVATLLGRLQAKGFVRSTRTGRDLHYVAGVGRDEYLAFETGRFMERFHRGSLRSLLASFAIPGALPPVVIDGHLYVDGSTVNNLPVDVMQRYGVSKIMAVDLQTDRIRKVDFDGMPSTLTLLFDRLRGAKRHYDLPWLPELLLNASALQSTERQRQMRAKADICFRPLLKAVGLLDWTRFDEAVRGGYETAREDIALLDPRELAAYR